MPVVKVFAKSQWDKFVRGLEALPDKPASERGVTVSEAMKAVKSHIRTAQTKGYTLGQIAEQAKRAGFDISPGTLKLALRGSSKGTKPRPTPKTASSRSTSGQMHGQSSVQSGALRADNTRSDVRQRRGGKIETNPNPTPIQTPLSFGIKPDRRSVEKLDGNDDQSHLYRWWQQGWCR